ncbi:MAG: hypothetical protein ACR2IT_12310 [Pirellulales bacterium]
MLRVRVLVGLVAIAVGQIAPAYGREASSASASTQAVVPQVPQDVLSAEEAGLVEVKFIANDSRSAQVVVTNRSDRPLSLRLPDGFAGVPVLAQMGQQGGGGFGAGGIGGGSQSVGGGGMGGMGGMGGGMGGGGMGGGMGGGPFSLPPERTRTIRVPTVCLEHGKRDPSPRVAYRMTALETFSSDPRLQEEMTALARGGISQQVAQAAAWHISSGLTWDQLAAEVVDMAGGVPDVPYFAPAELVAARRFVEESSKRLQTSAPESSESATR